MYPFYDHFLDANVLIASRIDWDVHHNDATEYMSRGEYNRHTSHRVYRESLGVFERNRRLILKYLTELYEKFEQTPNTLKIKNIIDKFTDGFVKKLKNRKEKNAIKSFAAQNFYEIQQIALGEENFGDFKREVTNAFKRAINTLDMECTPDHMADVCRYDGCPKSYEKYYPSEKSNLLNSIGYENDVLVLLDAYHIKNHLIKSGVCFITNDKEHILSKKDHIESILSGIHVVKPI